MLEESDSIRISVAMASYNGADYIEEQIDSILQNLSAEDEIVISDDGSTDGTRLLLEEKKRQDGRIRIVMGPQEGIIRNFENAISNCNGRYIFLSDQDDVWYDDKVEKVMQAFETQQCGLVMHDARVVNGTNDKVLMESFFDYRGTKEGAFHNIVKNSYMGCCMAFKSELKDVILPIPTVIQMHDQWIGVINDLCHYGTYILREPLLYYRRHEGNSSDFSHNSLFVMIRNRIVFLEQLRRRKGQIAERMRNRSHIS